MSDVNGGLLRDLAFKILLDTGVQLPGTLTDSLQGTGTKGDCVAPRENVRNPDVAL